MINHNIGVIVVTYSPIYEDIRSILQEIHQNVYKILIVNNGSHDQILYSLVEDYENACIINTSSNLGIAKAQNIAIRELSKDCDSFLFLDQDSLPSRDFIICLTHEVDIHKKLIYGPLHFEKDSGKELPMSKISKLGFRNDFLYSRSLPEDQENISFIISSGLFVSKNNLLEIGLMREDFFIDGVDTEFCLRARSMGFRFKINTKATLKHKIGSNNKVIVGKTLFSHNTQRVYYQIRNSIFFLRNKHIPKIFALSEMLRIVINRVVLAISSNNKLAYFRAISFGLLDGIMSFFKAESRERRL